MTSPRLAHDTRSPQARPGASLTAASGDPIVMGGRAQHDWRHSVPKQATPAGPRIGINFAPHLTPA